MNADKARGLMIGLAVGDCVGAKYEGEGPLSESYLSGLAGKPVNLRYTDDTAMALSLAESIVDCNGFDGHDMAMRFARGWQAEPYRGYGGSVRHVFQDLLEGVPWTEAAGRQFDGGGSFGNGGAMRVAPVALWAVDLDECVRLAKATARLTHTHPEGVDGAIVQAVAVWNALHGDELDLVRVCSGLVESKEFRFKLGMLPEALDRDDVDWVRDFLGNWVRAADSVISAQWCHLNSSSFEETVKNALRLGGDTDTIAAMAGAVSGARYGYEAIPLDWRGVEASRRLLDLADRLLVGQEETGREIE